MFDGYVAVVLGMISSCFHLILTCQKMLYQTDTNQIESGTNARIIQQNRENSMSSLPFTQKKNTAENEVSMELARIRLH